MRFKGFKDFSPFNWIIGCTLTSILSLYSPVWAQNAPDPTPPSDPATETWPDESSSSKTSADFADSDLDFVAISVTCLVSSCSVTPPAPDFGVIGFMDEEGNIFSDGNTTLTGSTDEFLYAVLYRIDSDIASGSSLELEAYWVKLFEALVPATDTPPEFDQQVTYGVSETDGASFSRTTGISLSVGSTFDDFVVEASTTLTETLSTSITIDVETEITEIFNWPTQDVEQRVALYQLGSSYSTKLGSGLQEIVEDVNNGNIAGGPYCPNFNECSASANTTLPIRSNSFLILSAPDPDNNTTIPEPHSILGLIAAASLGCTVSRKNR